MILDNVTIINSYNYFVLNALAALATLSMEMCSEVANINLRASGHVFNTYSIVTLCTENMKNKKQ